MLVIPEDILCDLDLCSNHHPKQQLHFAIAQIFAERVIAELERFEQTALHSIEDLHAIVLKNHLAQQNKKRCLNRTL
jgi:hypothetical protein